MKAEQILRAMTNIENVHILSAQNRLGYGLTENGRLISADGGKKVTLRAMIYIAAIVAILASLLAAVWMFRDGNQKDTYEFFDIAETEIVPSDLDIPTGSYMHSEAKNIGGFFESSYARLPFSSSIGKNSLLFCTDDHMLNSGNHFDAYVPENGQLVKLEEHSFSKVLEVSGQQFSVEFEWAEYEGRPVYTYIPSLAPFYAGDMRGTIHAAYIQLPIVNQGKDPESTAYPMLLDIETGTLTDFLSFADTSHISIDLYASVSPDGDSMFFEAYDPESGTCLYYANRKKQQLINIDRLIGEEVNQCALAGDTLLCWRTPSVEYGQKLFGSISMWKIPLDQGNNENMTAEKTVIDTNELPIRFLSGYPYDRGMGSPYAVAVDDAGNVYAVDLLTMTQYPIEGYRYTEYDFVGASFSPDGTKLLIYGRNTGNYYDTVTVIDFVQKRAVRFHHQNNNDMVTERKIEWMGNQYFVIDTNWNDFSDDYFSNPHDVYLYKILDDGKKPEAQTEPEDNSTIIDGYIYVDGNPVPVEIAMEPNSVIRGENAYDILLKQNPALEKPNADQEYILISLSVSYLDGQMEIVDLMQSIASAEGYSFHFSLPNKSSNSEDLTYLLDDSIYNIKLSKGETATGSLAFLQEKDNQVPLVLDGFGKTTKFELTEALNSYFVSIQSPSEPSSDMLEYEEDTRTVTPSDSDLVRVLDYLPLIQVDLRYASENNFTGTRIYEFSDVWLRYGTVKKLGAALEELSDMGYSLKIWDGFRPAAAQHRLWEVFPDATYVANPKTGYSSHTRGNTVDLTLTDSNEMELEMPTGFDDFSDLADRDYSDCPDAAAENAKLLESIMIKHGFTGYQGEWWHFTDSDSYPVEESFCPVIPYTAYAKCNEFITLRNAPDTGAEEITRIPANKKYLVLASCADFLFVQYNSQTGYVLASYTGT